MSSYLFDTATHRCTGNVTDISSLTQVIVHADVEEVGSLEQCARLVGVVAPCKAVAMDISFLLSIKDGQSVLDTVRLGTALKINVADISVVGRISVDAILIVGLRTVAVVIVSLTVLSPATHGSAGFAVVKVCHALCSLSLWEYDARVVSSSSVVSRVDATAGHGPVVVHAKTCCILGLTSFVEVGAA